MEPVGKFLLTELTEMPNNRENKQAFLSNESLSDDISNINHINRQDELDSVFE